MGIRADSTPPTGALPVKGIGLAAEEGWISVKTQIYIECFADPLPMVLLKAYSRIDSGLVDKAIGIISGFGYPDRYHHIIV
ncbi:MAG: hypothetical protein IMF00_05760 [Proteobacteria bacterium]|nr:hypothetical protein [Pseudomonadota bacterium]